MWHIEVKSPWETLIVANGMHVPREASNERSTAGIPRHLRSTSNTGDQQGPFNYIRRVLCQQHSCSLKITIFPGRGR